MNVPDVDDQYLLDFISFLEVPPAKMNTNINNSNANKFSSTMLHTKIIHMIRILKTNKHF